MEVYMDDMLLKSKEAKTHWHFEKVWNKAQPYEVCLWSLVEKFLGFMVF